MTRTVQSGEIDTSLQLLKGDITAWLDAGGSSDLLAAWLHAQLRATDERLCRAMDRSVSRGKFATAYRSQTLAQADAAS